MEAIVNGIRNSATLEILKSSWESALQMLPAQFKARINEAKEARKAELTPKEKETA